MLRREPCTRCGQPVFLAERLIVSSARLLYHRTCFRCARCNSQLTLANYYETEDGRFCCETCPDEEKGDCAPLAPLATLDDSASSSEPSRSPSVTVDTNDLPSNDACERVHSVDTVESSETEDYAKDRTDQSSLVQMRRKLFENMPKDRNSDVFDSGQLKVPSTQVSTNKDNQRTEETTIHEDEMPQAKEDEQGINPLKSRVDVEDRSSKSTVVEDDPTVSKIDVSLSREKEDEPSVPILEDATSLSREKECEPLELTKEAGGKPSVLKKKEDELLISREELPSTLRGESDGLPVSEPSGSASDADPLKIESTEEAPSDDPQSDDDKLSEPNIEDEEKQPESGVEVEPSPSQRKDETQSRKDVFEEGKNDGEKDVETVIPPRPPSPVVDTILKPPVSPRKTSPVVTPRKTSPAVTPKERSLVRTSSYPTELNPFFNDEEEIDEPVSTENSSLLNKDTSNPFGSEDEEEEEVTLRQKERPPRPSKPPQRPYTHHGVSVMKNETPSNTSSVDTRRLIPANLNPFWEDGEEPDDDEDDDKPKPDSTPQKPPVPKPRTVLSLSSDTSPGQPGSPFADRSNLTRSSGRFGSANSLSSVVSSASTMRRKKHAAPPPPVNSANSTLSPRATSLNPSAVSVPPSPTLSAGRSTLGRSRKSRPAPPPPSVSPINPNRSTWNVGVQDRPASSDPPSLSTSTSKSAQPTDAWQEGKYNKDEMNRNRQNQLSAGYNAEDPAEESSFHSTDKSSHGQWKRKKGPAPPIPIPQRRQIRAIPLKELKRELDDIEVLQLELERQGVNLERTIRRKFDENPDASESSMTPDIEDLVLQLFELVNEKNELFRKQAELMYLRRQQRLEEEHADLEYQIRLSMEQPERNKTDSDKAKEEKLIQRLVEVVERRNEIVECLEMDRLREAEEDHSIHSRLELFASKSLALNDAYINDLYKSTPALTCCARKEKKKKKDKGKKGTLRLYKKEKQVDSDKDIDETEVEQTVKEKKTKRKWF